MAFPRALVGVLLLATAPAAPAAEPAPVVREIEILRDNIFSETEAEFGAYDLANKLHFVTREHVIRQALLFEAGKPLDVELLEASERALRRLSFVNRVTIRVEPVDDETVDVVVTTEDAWSLYPDLRVQGGGSLARVGLDLEESNVLGFGKTLFGRATWESDVGTTWAGGYRDPNVWGSRWQAGGSFVTGPLTDGFAASATRPFFSPDTDWSYGTSGGYVDRIVRLFESGEEVSRIREQTSNARVFVSRAFGKRFRRRRVSLAFRYQNLEFDEILGRTTTPLPEDELIYATTLSGAIERVAFVEETQINKMVRVEDFRLGSDISVAVGRTGFPVPNGVERWELDGLLSHSFRFARTQYLLFSAAGSSRIDRDTIGSFRVRYYNKLAWWNTLALNLELDVAKDLQEQKQFVLGSESGLRGFGAREFTGDRAFLMNLESRIFTPIDVLAIRFGGVVFLDAGNAWQRGEPMDISDLNASAGIGLRMAFRKLPGEPISRIDFGWPLTEDGFAVTFGGEQQF